MCDLPLELGWLIRGSHLGKTDPSFPTTNNCQQLESELDPLSPSLWRPFGLAWACPDLVHSVTTTMSPSMQLPCSVCTCDKSFMSSTIRYRFIIKSGNLFMFWYKDLTPILVICNSTAVSFVEDHGCEHLWLSGYKQSILFFGFYAHCCDILYWFYVMIINVETKTFKSSKFSILKMFWL